MTRHSSSLRRIAENWLFSIRKIKFWTASCVSVISFQNVCDKRERVPKLDTSKTFLQSLPQNTICFYGSPNLLKLKNDENTVPTIVFVVWKVLFAILYHTLNLLLVLLGTNRFLSKTLGQTSGFCCRPSLCFIKLIKSCPFQTNDEIRVSLMHDPSSSLSIFFQGDDS